MGQSLYKTRSEHIESAIPPKLSVKADDADRQEWAKNRTPAAPKDDDAWLHRQRGDAAPICPTGKIEPI
jgi:hypothetical protein